MNALRPHVTSVHGSQVHWAYVDCVRWLGDIVLSKSVHGKVFLWEPDLSSKEARHKGYVKCYQVCHHSMLKLIIALGCYGPEQAPPPPASSEYYWKVSLLAPCQGSDSTSQAQCHSCCNIEVMTVSHQTESVVYPSMHTSAATSQFCQDVGQCGHEVLCWSAGV